MNFFSVYFGFLIFFIFDHALEKSSRKVILSANTWLFREFNRFYPLVLLLNSIFSEFWRQFFSLQNESMSFLSKKMIKYFFSKFMLILIPMKRRKTKIPIKWLKQWRNRRMIPFQKPFSKINLKNEQFQRIGSFLFNWIASFLIENFDKWRMMHKIWLCSLTLSIFFQNSHRIKTNTKHINNQWWS